MDELMVAMDAIDELRYEEKKMGKVLDEEGRRTRLKKRLKEIYAASGIEVTDAMLDAGIEALEKERFSYEPPRKTFSWYLARLYVARDAWLKPVLGAAAAVIVGFGAYYAVAVYPARKMLQTLPPSLERTVSAIAEESKEPSAKAQAQRLYEEAKQALASGDTEKAQAKLEYLKALEAQLNRHYRIRIVQRRGEPSGIWRVPQDNPRAKNYYLIVEAVDEEGNPVPVRVYDEERDKEAEVSRWGIRVDAETFRRIARDKRDDGIIQQRNVGIKKRGYLKPEYTVPTSGAAITHW